MPPLQNPKAEALAVALASGAGPIAATAQADLRLSPYAARRARSAAVLARVAELAPLIAAEARPPGARRSAVAAARGPDVSLPLETWLGWSGASREA